MRLWTSVIIVITKCSCTLMYVVVIIPILIVVLDILCVMCVVYTLRNIFCSKHGKM